MTARRHLVVTALVAALTVTATLATGVSPAAAASPPTFGVGDVAVREGDQGTKTISVPVTLSAPATATVTVVASTSDNTATGAGSGIADYTTRSAKLTFKRGETTKYLTVSIKGDTVGESDETFSVLLSGAVGATTTDPIGTVTIVNDDAPTSAAPTLSIGDVAIHRPDVGSATRTVAVPVSLSRPLGSGTVTVTYSTTHGTAVAGTDYQPVSGALTFSSTAKLLNINVPVLNAGGAHGTQDFFVTLGGVTGTAVAISKGIGDVAIIDRTLTGASSPVYASAPSGSAFYTPPSPLPSVLPGDVIWARQIAGPANATTWLVLYKSIGEKGQPIAVSGRVWIPTAPAPPGGRPVVAWTEATVGNNDSCAPSVNGYPVPYLADFLGAGATVASTDYEGLGTPGPHPYLLAASEAHTVLDSVRAARRLDAGTSNRVLVFGVSRGGHAGLAANELAKSYAPDLDVLGVAATGAGVIGPKFHPAEATDVNSIIGSEPSLILMFMASAENFLGDMTWPRYYLTDSGLPLVPQVETYCVGPVASSAFKLTRPKPTTAMLAQRAQFVVGARPGSGPVLLMHGTNDPLMIPAYMYGWATDACKLGHQTINLVYEDGAGHAPLDAFAQQTIEQWMLDRVNGVTPAPTNCASLPVR